MHRGYVKLWRKIEDNPRMSDPDFFAVWGRCLMLAAHAPREELFGGKRITCEPGQFTTGRIELSKKTGVQESKVERILKAFENEHQIEQQTSSVNRLISICNWSDYQQNEQQVEHQVNNDRTTNEQRMNTLKECKNVRRLRIREDLRTGEEPPVSPLWKTSKEEYLRITKEAFDSILGDSKEIEKQEKYFPGVNVKMSITRAFTEFWGTDAGYEYCKKNRKCAELNQRACLLNAIEKNKVWIPRDQRPIAPPAQETFRKML